MFPNCFDYFNNYFYFQRADLLIPSQYGRQWNLFYLTKAGYTISCMFLFVQFANTYMTAFKTGFKILLLKGKLYRRRIINPALLCKTEIDRVMDVLVRYSYALKLDSQNQIYILIAIYNIIFP